MAGVFIVFNRIWYLPAIKISNKRLEISLFGYIISNNSDFNYCSCNSIYSALQQIRIKWINGVFPLGIIQLDCKKHRKRRKNLFFLWRYLQPGCVVKKLETNTLPSY